MLSPGISITKLLKFAAISRSSWYYAQRPKLLDRRSENKGRNPPGYTVNRDGSIVPDKTIIQRLEQYRGSIEFHNGGGYIKLSHYLRKEHGLYINKKKLYRLCKEHQLLLPKRKKAKNHWRTISKNRLVTKPNELWEFDIKYGFIQGENRFFFVLAFVDVYTRKVVGSYVGSRCQAGDLGFTLTEAIAKNGCPLIIRSDNGPQMSSTVFYNYLQRLESKLCHEFIPPATPNKNAHIESFFSILEIEFIQPRYFFTLAEAYEQTKQFISFYNERRIHSSLKYRTPNEVLLAYANSLTLDIKPVSL